MSDTFTATKRWRALLLMGLLGVTGCGSDGDEMPGDDAGTGGGGAGSGGQTGSGGSGPGGADGGSGGASGSGGAPANSDAGDDAGGGTPAVRLVGRMDHADPNAPKFAWSGAGVVARFSGTSVGVRLGGGQQYTVLVDGMLRPKLIPTAGAVSPIASDLPPGDHTVEIYRRTEGNQGESQFLGFDFGGGTLRAPPPAPARRIELVGDSITCGYGVEGADMNCHYTPDTQSAYLTYGAISARDVGAEVNIVAWSGKGIVCNYGDDATSCVDPMPVYYDRTLPDRPTSQWDFPSWQPQAVIINLGTNDLSTAVDPSQAQFTDAYRTFLQHVRAKNPGALILCTIGPLLDGADLTTARTYINAAIAAVGDPRIKSFDLQPTNPMDGWGCDYHPSVKTHQRMAAVLTAKLKAELGW